MSTASQGAGGARPATGKITVPIDPARRPDVLLRRRMPDGHRMSPWWMIGSFLVISVGVIGLLNLFPF
ncbi:UDP-N-acetylmuramyl pentapeptide phosphotransferase [Microbacterium sp. W1N]|uniref:UDP-N-acetylmuramyl pentapeptide phosphotransferase n=1 Tax=Microbacterium festucae TaxID=2977531 RepID=UPI0021C0A090|nr:UDP-N-acetylmuramyl pentapeptide phosphotransferase [Microbacterium festucae]MCT9820521.1 UDP-N-acetylmuramyl pentapeptide phosphotransferase [Microbacterium festucae]